MAHTTCFPGILVIAKPLCVQRSTFARFQGLRLPPPHQSNSSVKSSTSSAPTPPLFPNMIIFCLAATAFLTSSVKLLGPQLPIPTDEPAGTSVRAEVTIEARSGRS